MSGMMGPFMGTMTAFLVVFWLVILVVLALLAAWLFQRVRHFLPETR